MPHSKNSRLLIGLEDDHLEVQIEENATEEARAEIIQALATIADFFGLQIEGAGGGSGGIPLVLGRTAPGRAHERPQADGSIDGEYQ